MPKSRVKHGERRKERKKENAYRVVKDTRLTLAMLAKGRINPPGLEFARRITKHFFPGCQVLILDSIRRYIYIFSSSPWMEIHSHVSCTSNLLEASLIPLTGFGVITVSYLPYSSIREDIKGPMGKAISKRWIAAMKILDRYLARFCSTAGLPLAIYFRYRWYPRYTSITSISQSFRQSL